ncbi:hypothetical protein [Xenorhabdus sp. PB62.4]|nr:hypothetical protein [Xenorhabdus sp. PB62.4]MBC8952334.1 phosphatidylinositol kinase [Xenorhabdus sp. PB62.4]
MLNTSLNVKRRFSDGSCRFQSIANELGIDKSLVTAIAQHMEQKWLDLKI